jgi:putative flavoprotein involved in K+ transport
MGAVLLGGLADASGERVAFRDNLAHNVRFADEASAAFRARIDAHITRVGADAPDPDPDPADEPWPGRFAPASPRRLHLRRAGIRTVIWATGFDAATSYVHAPVRGERGRIAHRDGATAMPGLFVTGQTWLRTRRSGTIHGVVADAPHVAELVAGRLAERRQVAA